jgi:hypothetical protein
VAPIHAKIEVAERRLRTALRGPPELLTHSDADHVRTAPLNKSTYLPTPLKVGRRPFIVLSDRGAFLRSNRMRGVELPVAIFDAASPLVPRNRGTDMVRAGALACSGDFLLRLAGSQSKNPIAEVR